MHVCRVVRSDHAVMFPDLYGLFLNHLPPNLESNVCISKYNSECYSHFYVLVGDAVESNGGSTELITILNRIGLYVL